MRVMLERIALGVRVLPACALLMTINASAQTDLSGSWATLRSHEEGFEEEMGDYAGLPVNDSIRLRADTWTPSLLTLPGHQCKPHGADRIDNFLNMRIWREVDLYTQEVTAYRFNVEADNLHRVVYMDGRPHPPEEALHTYMGFSTGRWDGDHLVVRTTHMKERWLRRNGLPSTASPLY